MERHKGREFDLWSMDPMTDQTLILDNNSFELDRFDVIKLAWHSNKEFHRVFGTNISSLRTVPGITLCVANTSAREICFQSKEINRQKESVNRETVNYRIMY